MSTSNCLWRLAGKISPTMAWDPSVLPKLETKERLLPITVNAQECNREKLSRSNSTYPSKRLLTCRSSSKCRSMQPLSNNKIMPKRWTSKTTNKTKKTMHTVTKWLIKTAVQIMTNSSNRKMMNSEWIKQRILSIYNILRKIFSLAFILSGFWTNIWTSFHVWNACR